jgi:hypothetical protein
MYSDPENPKDYWDTFTCLSFDSGRAGEIFNVTQILAGECTNCPEEIIQELDCHRELVSLVQELIQMHVPLMTEEQLHDETCDRRCCDARDPNYIVECRITPDILKGSSSGSSTRDIEYQFDDLFWSIDGPGAAETSLKFCEQYLNAACIPLYISWKDGAVWPRGGITG